MLTPDPCRRLFGEDQDDAPLVPEDMTSIEARLRATQAHLLGNVERVRQWSLIARELQHQEAQGLRPRPAEEEGSPFDE